MLVKNKKQDQQKGTVLLMTLLIMIGLLAATVGLAFIVINELQQSRDLDYSVIAYYAAETAVEQGLYQLRKTRAEVDDLISETPTLLAKSGASWTRAVSASAPQVSAAIKEKESFTVDLYDSTNPGEPLGIQSLKIKKNNWLFMDDTWLEATLAEWTPGLGLAWEQQFRIIYKEIYRPSEDPIVINTPQPDSNYQLRIKALYDDAPNFTVTAWSEDDAGGEQLHLPDLAVITGLGDYVHSRQAVQVQLAKDPPLSGLFDYIIFSEEGIDKGPE